MGVSIRQKIEEQIMDLKELIEPELKRINELEHTLEVIDSVEKGRKIKRVEVKVENVPRKRKTHRPKTRYGSKTIPEYIRIIGKEIQPFSAKDVRLAIHKRWGYNIKRSSISAALSLMCQSGELKREKMGLYKLR